MDLEHQKALRLEELRPVLRRLRELAPGGTRLLEIGAGAGWQASLLASEGFSVEAIDVASSRYRTARIHPVTVYDGVRIPFPDGSFDIVFSSNVLEHLPDPVAFQAEILRVLDVGGIAVHTLPTATWRVWTMVTWYPELIRALGRKTVRAFRSRDRSPSAVPVRPRRSAMHLLLAAFVAPRHGEVGNALTEAFHFRRRRWQRLFCSTGWEILLVESHRLFLTGNRLFGKRLNFETRRSLSRVLGSSTRSFYLRPGSQPTGIDRVPPGGRVSGAPM